MIEHRTPPDESQPLVVLPFTLPVAWIQSKRRQTVHWEVAFFCLDTVDQPPLPPHKLLQESLPSGPDS